MKISIALFLFLLFKVSILPAQYTLHIVVTCPANTNQVYVAGTFNDWNPENENYKLYPAGTNKQQIILHNIDTGKIELKFTRGNWELAESDGKAGATGNRECIIRSDTTLILTVAGWIDDYVDLSVLPDSTRFIAMIRRGFIFLDRNLDTSDKYATDIYALSLKLHSTQMEAYALDLQGNVLAKRGLIQEALNTDFKAIEVKNRLTDEDHGVGFVYNSIADLYYSNKDEIKAKEYYSLCLSMVPLPYNKGTGPNDFVLNSNNNLGEIFLHENNIDSALFYANRANAIGDGKYSQPLLLLGDIQQKLGNNDSAMKYFKRAAIAGSINKLTFVAQANQRIATMFNNKGQKDSALKYARSAFATATAIKNPFTIVNTGTFLVELFKKGNRLDSAFLYQEKVLQAKDSLFNMEKERQMQAGYYNQKMKEQDLAAQNEKFQSQLKIYALIGSLLILILLGLQYRSRLKTNFYKKAAVMEMKALRAQMNPHFIFNCLTSINRYIVKSDNKTASNYLTKFAKLIRLILDNSAADYITLDAEIQTLQLYMDMEALRFDHAFEYEIQTNDAAASENISIPSMLVQPYAENAIWHGLMQKEEKGKLWIRFLKQDDNVLKVEIEDNGIGRQKAKETESKDALKRKSYGMQISKDRIELINKLNKYNTSVKVLDMMDEDGKASGTKITIIIPVYKILSTDNIKKS